MIILHQIQSLMSMQQRSFSKVEGLAGLMDGLLAAQVEEWMQLLACLGRALVRSGVVAREVKGLGAEAGERGE